MQSTKLDTREETRTALLSRLRVRADIATWVPVMVLGTLLVYILTYNMSFFPRISLDEGSHLHVPKNLVLYGEYAEKTSEGYNYYGPGVALGPTVMLPIALMFKLFGIGLIQARIITGLYIIGALIVISLSSRHLFGRSVAICTGFLLLVAPGFLLNRWVEGGRVVVGEVPALFFLAAGFLYFWKHMEQLTPRRLAVVGGLWGLAFITKNQYPLIFVPTAVILGLLGRFYYRAIRVRDVWIPLAIAIGLFGIWYLAQLALIGGGNVSENIRTIREASGSNYLVFSTELMLKSARFLTSVEVFYGWAVAGIAYGVFLSLRRTQDGFKCAMILLTILAWLSWYVFASVGAPRYSYPPLQLATIFLAKLFYDLIGGFSQFRWDSMKEWVRNLNLERARQFAVFLFLIMTVAVPLERENREILRADDRSQYEFAEYLEAEVDETAVIETFEYTMGFLTEHNYHYPPTWALGYIQSHAAGKSPPPSALYNPLEHDPDYLVLGFNSKAIPTLYSEDAVEECWDHVHSIGDYDLYERRDDNPRCATSSAGTT